MSENYESGPEFDPDFLTTAERAILARWDAQDEGRAALFGRVARLTAGFVRDARRRGRDDDAIRDEVLGHAADTAAEDRLPGNRESAAPRDEFYPMAKAALRWAMAVTASDVIHPIHPDRGEEVHL